MLSVVMPAQNEEDLIEGTVSIIYKTLSDEHIPHEIIVVNDHSKDSTQTILDNIKTHIPTLRVVKNDHKPGFGRAVITGLNEFKGDYVAIMMADLSDDPKDLVRFWRVAERTHCDCVFGSRFIRGGATHDYPKIKLILNRFINNLVKVLFRISYNDCTNAFKMYKKETIQGLRPFLAPHFNLTLELSLKSIVRGYSYEVIPNSWHNRKGGTSKLKLKEMGSRYVFILLYCLIEYYFSRGDFHKSQHEKAK
jgi:dolichol-phosphate mannosyltransferase